MWLASGGQRGECPEIYTLIRAARYLRVPPWELLEQPNLWAEWAVAIEGAEAWAEREQIKRQEWKR